MKKLFTLIIASALSVAAMAISVKDVVNPHIDNPADYVSDMAAILSNGMEDSINNVCLKLDSIAKMEVAVATIDSLGDNDAYQFSLDLYEAWGIGKGDNGILIFVSVKDHQWQIRTGYKAEGTLTDALCSTIGRNKMVPMFKQNNYGQGIYDAVDYMLTVATSPAAMAELEEESKAGTSNGGSNMFLYIIIGLLIAGAVYIYIQHEKSKPACPDCGKKKCKSTGSTVLDQPTYTSEGRKETTYTCKECGKVFTVITAIPMLTKAAEAAAEAPKKKSTPKKEEPQKGSFGGGHTGGGGAGGSW